MGKWFTVLLVCFATALPLQAQEETPASSTINYKMERNLLNRATINLSRARQLCYSARQSNDLNAETTCAQVDTATAQMQQICDSAIAKGVIGAVGVCNSLLRPQS